MSNAAVNIDVQSLFDMLISSSLNIHPGLGLLGHMVILFLMFWDTSELLNTFYYLKWVLTLDLDILDFFLKHIFFRELI
jgi:hypothetical protein